jgi:site-specific DNA-adenine methylase
MGSKDVICDELIKVFPKADHFYDLFGGGFSVTHAIMTRRFRHFKEFHYNEIKSDVVDLVRRSIQGKFNYDVFKPEWISKDEFHSRKASDAFVRVCWSFGNDQKNYLFGQDIEPYKRSVHQAVVFNEFDDLAKKVFEHDGFKDGYSILARRLFLRAKIERFRLDGIPSFLLPYLSESQRKQLVDPQGSYQLEQLHQLHQLQQLERLERLERLQRLQQVSQPQFHSVSYDQVEIKPNSIIYCDPPYAGTADYGGEFSHARFLDWAHEKTEPVFISEYHIPDKRFRLIKQIKKRSMMAGAIAGDLYKNENIYINQAAIRRFL